MALLLVVEVVFRLFQIISYFVTIYGLFKHTAVPVWQTIRDFRYGHTDSTVVSRKWYSRKGHTPVDVNGLLPFSRFEKDR